MKKQNKPLVSLWNTQATPILWINDGFDHARHLELRGLDKHMFRPSFGTANREEALRRQSLIRLFVENEALRAFVLDNHFNKTAELVRIPSDGQSFLNYFNPQKQNIFWEKIEQFNDIISEVTDLDQINQALLKIVQYIKEEKARLEATEAQMGGIVIDQLLKATTLDGTITLQLGIRDDKWCFTVIGKEAVGHRLYALNPPEENASVPKFLDSNFCRKIGIYDLACWYIKRREKSKIREWASPIIITECPNEISRDICAYMNNILQEGIEEKNNPFPLPDGKASRIIDIVIRFYYGANGLKIKLVGISENQTVPEEFEENWSKPSNEKWNRYYTENEINRLSSMQGAIRRHSYITQLLTEYYPKLKEWFSINSAEIIAKDGMQIRSPASNEQFKWSHAETICKADWAETYEAAKDIRAFTAEHMKTLLGIAQIADRFVCKSKDWNLPISFPEIIDATEATLSFDALWPVDLIGRKTSGSKGRYIIPKDLRPITALGNLAAGISMLTGGNGAGKTTTGEELLGVLHDAASGFPVFGQNVKLNLRTVIGSIYLARGDGSTMQLSMEKLAAVLVEVAKHPMNGTFVFWDEAGTGTTASQGERLGMATLGKLRQIGCTVLVNTQIPSLAENAQLRLKAKCFQVDMGHKIKEGIGQPDIGELAREMGLDKVLNLN